MAVRIDKIKSLDPKRVIILDTELMALTKYSPCLSSTSKARCSLTSL